MNTTRFIKKVTLFPKGTISFPLFFVKIIIIIQKKKLKER